MHKSHQKEAKANTKSCKIIWYYPRLKGSIIDHTWRGGSISLAVKSREFGIGARSGEGLEDEEGLQVVW